MRTSNLTELLDTIEKIRVQKYPHIPKELVEDIVNEEFQHQDARMQGLEKIKDLIVEYFDKQGV